MGVKESKSTFADKWVAMAPIVIIALILLVIITVSLFRESEGRRQLLIDVLSESYKSNRDFHGDLTEAISMLDVARAWAEEDNLRHEDAPAALEEVMNLLVEIQDEMQYNIEEYERKYPSLTDHLTR